MHPHRYYHLALALLALSAIAAALMAGVVICGMQLTLAAAIGALLITAALFAGMVFVHDALRAARWNAGHRLR
jgi:hypothetical protein